MEKQKTGKLMLKYLFFIGISIISLIIINVVLILIINNQNNKDIATVTARNLLKLGDRSRMEIDRIWNLDYISNDKIYVEKYGDIDKELYPLLIGIENIRESVKRMNFDPNNNKDDSPMEFKVLKVDTNIELEMFKEPDSNELKIINHIIDKGYGDYRIVRDGKLEFYRPMIINHNRLQEKLGAKRDYVIGLYKLTIPISVLSHFLTNDFIIPIIFNLIFILAIVVLFYLILGNKAIQLKRITSFLDKMVKGNFTGEIKLGSKDELDRISIYINKICKHIREMGLELDSAVEYMQESSETFHQFSSELSSSSKKQFIQIQEINESIANLSNEISQSTGIAGDVNTKSQNSLTTAEASNRYVKEVIDDMVYLTNSTKKIEDILKVIKEIAFQTNLLAHNASIEAARAGEQGKGFSVVAQSVSELAKKSAESTKEIEELIKTSINDLETGTKKVTNLGENFITIKNQLDEIANLANRMNDIIKHQSEESYHVKDSINRINKISHDSSQKATLMEDNIEELKNRAKKLNVILEKNIFSNEKSKNLVADTKKITLRKKQDNTSN